MTDFELPPIDWGVFEGLERPLAVLCIEVSPDVEGTGIVRWCSSSAAELFKDSPHNVVGKSLYELSPTVERDQISRNLQAIIEGKAPGKVHQVRKYVDRFGNEFEQGLQSLQLRGDAWMSFLHPPGSPTDDRTLELLMKAAAALSPASTGSQVINITGQDVSDKRNQSVTAGRDAAAHGGEIVGGLKSRDVLIAIVVLVALFLGYRLAHNSDGTTATPDGAGVNTESAEEAE